MSQNNYTLILQKEENLYEISNRDIDSGFIGKTYKARTLREAVEKANEEEARCYLGSSEYGITIKLLTEYNKEEAKEF